MRGFIEASRVAGAGRRFSVWGTAAQDEPIKIGIVDIDQAISSTDEGKAAREEFARKQREAERRCSR